MEYAMALFSNKHRDSLAPERYVSLCFHLNRQITQSQGHGAP